MFSQRASSSCGTEKVTFNAKGLTASSRRSPTASSIGSQLCCGTPRAELRLSLYVPGICSMEARVLGVNGRRQSFVLHSARRPPGLVTAPDLPAAGIGGGLLHAGLRVLFQAPLILFVLLPGDISSVSIHDQRVPLFARQSEKRTMNNGSHTKCGYSWLVVSPSNDMSRSEATPTPSTPSVKRTSRNAKALTCRKRFGVLAFFVFSGRNNAALSAIQELPGSRDGVFTTTAFPA